MADINNEVEKHVAVLAFPFGSHAAPLLSLVNAIAATAPFVKFSFFSTAVSNRSTFSGSANQENNVKPYDVPDGLAEGYVVTKNPMEPMELFLKATPGNFRSVMEAAAAEAGRKINCVMSDAFFAFAGKMAKEMDVPWVPLWTAGPHSLLVHVDTEVIRQRLGYAGREDQIVDFIPGFSAVGVADLPEGIVLGNLDSPFSKMLYDMGLALPQATAVAINSFEELDPVIVNELKSRFQKFLNIGPFPLTLSPPFTSDEHGCLHWLDMHKTASVAYISFGRVITLPPHELTAMAEALEATGIPFLWSFRGNIEGKLPEGFIERTSSSRSGKLVPWAPQMQVLEHRSVGVFVTHCGWNSVLESIAARVPMICRPVFGDQKLNRRIVESVWGIGMGIEDEVFTKDGAVKALELTLLSERGKKMREKAEACFKRPALKAVGPDGSSRENFKTLVELITK
ncbi:hypothetical protein I3760_08G038200 [Carya illinoinensis]|uniref:Glycosyltransferase n=1 Tax=Carya illinoinensis TaxID=32201 RepID=A0A8T1PID8_CARIL|nr:flavonoid 3-O-glucosyltransferase-like [Carya illinoinensis]KAG2692137.1 hypothetical protein I3760_08G038200 [Carya illinoinensis]KAG6644176.1 hypothetical protein CIPAW_08G037500 [Carya illinoinensis]